MQMVTNCIGWQRPVVMAAVMGLFFLPAVCLAGSIWDPRDLPASVRMVLAEAGTLMNQEKYGAAVEKLLAFEARGRSAEARGGAPHAVYSHPMIHFALGNAYLLQEAYVPARQAFEWAVTLSPEWVPAWLNLAKAHYELDAPAEAAHCFFTAYEKGERQNAEYLYLSAAAHLMAQQYGDSIARFELLLARHPDQIRADWREYLVHALLSDGRHRQALPHMRLLARTYEGDKRVQWQEILLHQYMHLEMHAEALALARALVEEAPTLAKWWKAKAHLHLNAREYEPALVAMTIYSYLGPLNRDDRRLLADLHLHVGIPGQAVVLYEGLLQSDEADKRVLNNLMIALRQLGRPDAALRRLEKQASRAD